MIICKTLRHIRCGRKQCVTAKIRVCFAMSRENMRKSVFFFLWYLANAIIEMSGIRSHELNKKDLIHQNMVRKKKSVTWTSGTFDVCFLLMSIRGCVSITEVQCVRMRGCHQSASLYIRKCVCVWVCVRYKCTSSTDKADYTFNTTYNILPEWLT